MQIRIRLKSSKNSKEVINTLNNKNSNLISQKEDSEGYIEAPKEVQDRIDRMRG